VERCVVIGLGSILTAPFTFVGGLLGGLVSSVGGDVITAIAKAIMQSLNQAIATVGTLWVQIGTPNLTSTDGGSTPSDAVGYIQGHLWWYMTGLAVCGVLVGCGRMAWEQRADAGRDVLRSLAVYVAVSGAGLTVIALAVSASDQFSTWIISQSVHGPFGVQLTALLGLTAASSGFGAILVIVLGLLALLASLVQILLMVLRGGMLVILAGILPTTAAFTSTQAGRQWFRKSVSWLLAFILYKPAAAIVYATAFRLSSSNVFGSGGLLNVITGLSLMVLALLALPALMRFVTPMVGAVAAGGAGTMLAAAGGAAAVAMPSGALRSVSAHLRGGGSEGGSGPQGSSGAPGSGGGLPGGGGPADSGGSGSRGGGGIGAGVGAVAGNGAMALRSASAAAGASGSAAVAGGVGGGGRGEAGGSGAVGAGGGSGRAGTSGVAGAAGTAGAAGGGLAAALAAASTASRGASGAVEPGADLRPDGSEGVL
jgi:type IV secretion system protein TrbL